MTRWTLWIAAGAVAAAACGGSGAARPAGPAAPAGTGAAAGGLPALYASLFVEGKRWELPAERVDSHYEENGPVSEKTQGTVTCTISGAREIKGGRRAELACEGTVSLPTAISFTIIGTPTGLYLVDEEFADDIAKLTEEQRLVASPPKAYSIETKEGEGEGQSVRAAKEENGSWCFVREYMYGDEAGWSICLSEGAGIAGGTSYAAGGFSHDVYFGVSIRG